MQKKRKMHIFVSIIVKNEKSKNVNELTKIQKIKQFCKYTYKTIDFVKKKCYYLR